MARGEQKTFEGRNVVYEILKGIAGAGVIGSKVAYFYNKRVC